MKNIISHIYPPIPKISDNQRYIVLFGFGDTDASISIVKFFSNIGYNIIVLNEKSMMDLRKTYDLDKHDGINNLNTHIIQFSYDEFFSTFKQQIQSFEQSHSSIKIDYIFDCTILRYITNTKNLDDFSESIFYIKEINLHVDCFIELIEVLKYHMNGCKIFMMNYLEKVDDVNHKLLADLKYCIIKNYKKIYNTRIEFIKKVTIKNKFIHMNDADVKSIYLSSVNDELIFS